MEISRSTSGGVIELAVVGRLDGSWADHLDRTLAEVVREGHQDVRLNLGGVTFISSAGVGVLVRHYRQLIAIGGSFLVVSPSQHVDRMLRLANLADWLIGSSPRPAGPPTAAAVPRRIARGEATFDVFELEPSATLRAEVAGREDAYAASLPVPEDDVCLGSRTPLFAVAVGAFGSSFDECRDRYGEMISVAGATAYQPADATNVTDYLVSPGPLPSDVRVLYGLLCEGRFAHLLRFDVATPGAAVSLGTLLACCREVSGSSQAGAVIVAETAGLIGASLSQSPVAGRRREGFFTHPGIRSRLTFTAEPAYARTLVLAAAFVSAAGPSSGARQLRPMAPGLVGHAHAAAFGFRSLRKGRIDLRETVSALFEDGALLGVLHLLSDDRESSGAGESRFIRGACWTAPIAGWVDPPGRSQCSC